LLQLSVSPQSESFRQGLREWLNKNPPPPRINESSLEDFQKVGREWQKQLSGGRWIGVHWPSEFGGRGLTLVEEAIVQEELVRVHSPQVLGLFGLTMVGPVLIRHGTEEQKKRFLSKILSGEEIWCQGFSETGAGSDLANVKTRADLVEGGMKISGHKVWTSFAHIADWCFVLCRTSESTKKHEGLTYLLVDMKSPGITVRPLQQISGDKEFNEVYFDDVFVPSNMVVGALGDGWKIAISTLMFERVVLTFARQLQSEVALREMLKVVSSDDTSRAISDALKKNIALCVADACAARALAYEHLVDYSSGKSPGPEGSMDKLLWSESFQQLCKVGMELSGADIIEGEHGSVAGAAVHRYLYSRGRTIAAGTSEIQRNIIAERLLGLPRLDLTFNARSKS
jgi:alkylation response protein AidB-like acyl-CoA dehydrogenase